MIEILSPGPFATVQDGGRPGYADLGVARSGAFDRTSLRLANRLVGNPADAAAIEVTLGGLSVRLLDASTVALTGAACIGLDWGTAISFPAGSVLRLAAPLTGLRSYVAVRGAIAVAPQLGSRSTDTLSGLGPAPLQAGERLAIGPEPDTPVDGVPASPDPPRTAVAITPGPRADWFADATLDLLTSASWTVRPQSNRVGIRLDGPALRRTLTADLPSEATLPGAVQVPPDGRPIVLGPDAPVTGGYPVLAVVRERDLDIAAQLRPGDTLSFRLSP